MKRIALMVCAVLGLALSSGSAQASWGHLFYSGYQPWWNIFAKRYKCLTPEEERLQKFWHDYYDALKNFYCALDHVDWVAYYKNHGYAINNGVGNGAAGCGACRINYAPVFVTPTLQWAVPAGCAGGPPVGPPYAAGMPMGGAPAMPHGLPYPAHAMGGMPMGPAGVPMGAPTSIPPVTGGLPTTTLPPSPGAPTPPATN
jgi:hypothetical protein